jgi:DNA-binding MarR family transcriptional regulator
VIVATVLVAMSMSLGCWIIARHDVPKMAHHQEWVDRVEQSQRKCGESFPMNTDSDEQRVDVLRQTIIALVRREGPDLTARQLGVFLTCYLDDEAQTVRGLAAKLKVSKPAITRALDRLSEFDLVRRKTDPLDRRSVLAQRTATGMAFLRDLKKILAEAGGAADKTPARTRRPVPA